QYRGSPGLSHGPPGPSSPAERPSLDGIRPWSKNAVGAPPPRRTTGSLRRCRSGRLGRDALTVERAAAQAREGAPRATRLSFTVGRDCPRPDERHRPVHAERVAAPRAGVEREIADHVRGAHDARALVSL